MYHQIKTFALDKIKRVYVTISKNHSSLTTQDKNIFHEWKYDRGTILTIRKWSNTSDDDITDLFSVIMTNLQQRYKRSGIATQSDVHVMWAI